jgi:hypothetical protein
MPLTSISTTDTIPVEPMLAVPGSPQTGARFSFTAASDHYCVHIQDTSGEPRPIPELMAVTAQRFSAHLRGPGDHARKIFTLMALETWLEELPPAQGDGAGSSSESH